MSGASDSHGPKWLLMLVVAGVMAIYTRWNDPAPALDADAATRAAQVLPPAPEDALGVQRSPTQALDAAAQPSPGRGPGEGWRRVDFRPSVPTPPAR